MVTTWLHMSLARSRQVCPVFLRPPGLDAAIQLRVHWFEQQPGLQLWQPMFYCLRGDSYGLRLSWRASVRVASAVVWFCGWRAQARASCVTSTAVFCGASGLGVLGSSCSKFHSPGGEEGDVQTRSLKFSDATRQISLLCTAVQATRQGGTTLAWYVWPGAPWMRCCFRWALFLNFGFKGN